MAKQKPPIPVGDFPISKRTINLLASIDIHTSEDFINFTLQDIKAIEGLGATLVTELQLFLKGAKIKLKKSPPKEKKAPRWDLETKEIMLFVLNGQVSNFGIEMQKCGQLIEKYGAETIRNSRIPEKVQPPTFRYFFTGGRIAAWCDNYFRQFAPIRLKEAPVTVLKDAGGSEEPISIPNAPEVAYVPKEKAPSSLADFLKFRK